MPDVFPMEEINKNIGALALAINAALVILVLLALL
jgi:hypothetical protein